jgi:hypothetical protein
MRKFYRTVVQIEILSEGLYHGHELGIIDHDITEGECSGSLSDVVRNWEVDGPTMAKLLIAQGSDTAFFNLKENGTPETVKVRFSSIVWDTEGEKELGLPTECILDVDAGLDLEQVGADVLSDAYGWCVQSFDYEVVKTL